MSRSQGEGERERKKERERGREREYRVNIKQEVLLTYSWKHFVSSNKAKKKGEQFED